MSKANNLSDFLTGVANAIRTKKGTTDPINAQNYEDEILSIAGGGATLNIHYGLEAPEDTSKLWVKLENEPSKVKIGNSIEGESSETIENSTLSLLDKATSISSVAVGTKVYLFGGCTSLNTTYLNTINVFDTETNTITTLSATLPTATSNMASIAVGTKIYLFGGYYGDYDNTLDTINVFDTETNTITTLDTKLQNPTYDIAVASVGTKIYLFGGYCYSGNNYYYDTIQVFDTETNTITTLSTTLPIGTQDIVTATIETKVYLFGGYDGTTYLNTINVFDTETNTITTLDTILPTSAYSIGCASVGTKVYLFGGRSGKWNNSSAYLNTINVFDTETNTITTLDTILQTGASNIAVASVGTKIYLFGGEYYNSTTCYLNTIQIFTALTTYTLENGTLFLLNKFNANKVSIMKNDSIDVEIELEKALLGNADNVGEEVEYGIYNNGAWVGNITIDPNIPEDPDTPVDPEDPETPETITDLTGKTITFNESLTNSESKAYNLSFTTGSNEQYIELRIIAGQNITYANGNNVGPVYENGVWVDETYKTIQATGGADATNTELISKIQAIATIK